MGHTHTHTHTHTHAHTHVDAPACYRRFRQIVGVTPQTALASGSCVFLPVFEWHLFALGLFSVEQHCVVQQLLTASTHSCIFPGVLCLGRHLEKEGKQTGRFWHAIRMCSLYMNSNGAATHFHRMHVVF